MSRTMLAERWQEITRVYNEARARDIETRAAFLAQVCAGDEVLRREVELLLAQAASAEAVFAEAPADVSAQMVNPAISLMTGRRLGSYHLVELLGRGGMGEVYLARDAKLGRDVAIKILPHAFTADPERLARFEREARVLASVSHPNIGAIYGIEEASWSGPAEAGYPTSRVTALVLELVEGDTLAERIAPAAGRKRVPLRVQDALDIARQIADALEAAHEKGIVHRDLKPANIKITPAGVVKVLDFGLAKVTSGESVTDESQSPTMSIVARTREGVILGTVTYMSPEQARGLPLDKRSDIWSFGCVLYEMLTGRAPFTGGTVSDIIAGILERDPDWSSLPTGVPTSVRRLLRRCLDKDPKHRLRDIGDARFELVDEAIDPTPPLSKRGRLIGLLSMTTVAVALTSLILSWTLWWPRAESPRGVERFVLNLSPQDQFSNTGRQAVAISPNGTHIVYSANGRLYVRALDDLNPRPIAGTRGEVADNSAARNPFFSPDGRWIGFWQAEQLKKVALTGGAALTVCEASNPWGVRWASDGTILYGEGPAGIWRVSDSGGSPQNIIPMESGFSAHGPQLLPDGRTIIFTQARERDWDNAAIVAYSQETGARTVLLRGASDARYVASGHLVYVSKGVLLAVPFDAATLTVTGSPVAVVEQVAVAGQPSGAAHFDVSADGTLVYLPASALSGPQLRRTLVWVDRTGRETPVSVAPRTYTVPRLSPDGARAALDIRDQDNDIWILELTRGTLTRLTSDEAEDRSPIWSTDGQRVFFASNRSGKTMVYSQQANGIGTAEAVGEGSDTGLLPNGLAPTGLTPDGQAVIVSEFSASDQRFHIAALRVGVTTRARMLVQTPFNDRNGIVSPNGRWLAYDSDSSGQREVFVRPFPDVANGQWQVSTTGGQTPLWSRDGSELFYISGGRTLVTVPVGSGTTWQAGVPKPLVSGDYFFGGAGATYDVSPDGTRFLMVKNDAEAPAPATVGMIVVQNWTVELRRLAPTN